MTATATLDVRALRNPSWTWAFRSSERIRLAGRCRFAADPTRAKDDPGFKPPRTSKAVAAPPPAVANSLTLAAHRRYGLRVSFDVTFGRLGVRALSAVLLLAACGDDAPSGPADSGNPSDVITDRGADDVQGDDVLPDAGGPDVIDPDAGDVPAADVIGDVPTPDAGDGGLTGLRAHTATGLVGAGGVMTSAGYRMISTLGQSTIHQGTLQSASYRLRGGLVGASGGRGR